MQRLLPFRQYAEQDVINLFSRSAINTNITDSGNGDSGLFVKVTAGDLSKDPIEYASQSYLTSASYPHVFGDMYPSVPHKIAAATAGSPVLGVTLKQVAAYDENGQKMIFTSQAHYEGRDALPSGVAEPVLKRGIIELASGAIDGTLTINQKIAISANAGKITGVGDTIVTASGVTVVGHVLATGSRSSNGGIADPLAGPYAIVYIDCK